jgi:hypothetical protein
VRSVRLLRRPTARTRQAGCHAAADIAGALVGRHADDGDAPERGAGLAVASPIEPVPCPLATAGLHGRGAAEAGEVAGKAPYVVPEVPDERGSRTDFLVPEGGIQVWHWVKHASRPWGIPRLAQEGVLKTCRANADSAAAAGRAGAGTVCDHPLRARSALACSAYGRSELVWRACAE